MASPAARSLLTKGKLPLPVLRSALIGRSGANIGNPPIKEPISCDQDNVLPQPHFTDFLPARSVPLGECLFGWAPVWSGGIACEADVKLRGRRVISDDDEEESDDGVCAEEDRWDDDDNEDIDDPEDFDFDSDDEDDDDMPRKRK